MCSTATRLSIGILTVAPAGEPGPPRGEGEFRPIWPNTPRGRNWIAADERAVIAQLRWGRPARRACARSDRLHRTLAGATRMSGATQSSAGAPVYSLSEVHCT